MDAKLVQLIESSLALRLHENAIFYGEMLVTSARTEMNRHLLACVYVAAGRVMQAVELLAESRDAANRYLAASLLISLGAFTDAESTLLRGTGLAGMSTATLTAAVTANASRVPNGAAGVVLLAQAAHGLRLHDRAAALYRAALKIDPFMWCAFTALCKLEPAHASDALLAMPDVDEGEAAAAHATPVTLATVPVAQGASSSVGLRRGGGVAPAKRAPAAGHKRGLDQVSQAPASAAAVATGAAGLPIMVPTPELASPVTPAMRLQLSSPTSAAFTSPLMQHTFMSTAPSTVAHHTSMGSPLLTQTPATMLLVAAPASGAGPPETADRPLALQAAPPSAPGAAQRAHARRHVVGSSARFQTPQFAAPGSGAPVMSLPFTSASLAMVHPAFTSAIRGISSTSGRTAPPSGGGMFDTSGAPISPVALHMSSAMDTGTVQRFTSRLLALSIASPGAPSAFDTPASTAPAERGRATAGASHALEHDAMDEFASGFMGETITEVASEDESGVTSPPSAQQAHGTPLILPAARLGAFAAPASAVLAAQSPPGSPATRRARHPNPHPSLGPAGIIMAGKSRIHHAPPTTSAAVTGSSLARTTSSGALTRTRSHSGTSAQPPQRERDAARVLFSSAPRTAVASSTAPASAGVASVGYMAPTHAAAAKVSDRTHAQSLKRSHSASQNRAAALGGTDDGPAALPTPAPVSTSEQIAGVLHVGGVHVLQRVREYARVCANLSVYMCRDAAARMRDAHEAVRTSPLGMELAARIAYELGKYEQCCALFARLRDKHPSRLDGLEWYSSALWHTKDALALQRLCAQTSTLAQHAVVSAAAARAVHASVVGNALSLQRKHVEAAHVLSNACTHAPRNEYVRTLAGHEYAAMGEFDTALSHFRAALDAHPRAYSAVFGIANVCLKQDQLDSAADHLQRAIAMNKFSATLHCSLGTVHIARRGYSAAVTALQEALRLEPGHPQARYQLAVAHIAQAQYKEARVQLEAVRDVAPREPAIHVQLGKVCKRLHDIAAATRAWEDALAHTRVEKDRNLIKNMLMSVREEDDNDDGTY